MWRDLRVPFLTILFALLSLFIFTKIFGPIPFSVQSVVTNKDSLFTSTGTGEVAAVPDTAMVTLGVNTTSPTVEAAQDDVNTKINQITEDLKSLGIEERDIKTSNYSVNPQYDFDNGRQTPNGYQVNATISVEIKPVEQANQVIDTAARNGANQIGGLQFVLDDEKQNELEQQAVEQAINDAKQRAGEIAKAAGIKLGRVIDVQVSNNKNGGPVPLERTMELNTADVAQTELEPGENKVTVTVTLSYETF